MSRGIPDKIGSVSLKVAKNHPDEAYSDHEAEDTLLDLFTGEDIEKKQQQILANSPSWALYYHLNPRRGNLIKWYEFNEGASVLEIGAGCGAITEVLVENNVKVTALELTRKRALINAHRNKNASNLSLYIGNLDNFESTDKFDYVVCVGVLEYAGTFFHSKTPYESFISQISGLLKPGGRLLLAIENRFGMKYWTGAKEDHVHTFFEGQSGYPGKKRVQTFGKKELENLLMLGGFSKSKFYYPFPDYKNPSFVYSDSYYPGKGAHFPLGSLPTPTLDRPREYFLSEQALMINLEANGLFPDFSNSFLVESTK